MIYNTFELHQEGSLPGAHLVTYIQEYSEAMAINDRPLILLCPGGGYTRTSDREAEPMALKFLAMGYRAALFLRPCGISYFLKGTGLQHQVPAGARERVAYRSPQDRSGRLFCGRTPGSQPWGVLG